jgi:hypothetical protein
MTTEDAATNERRSAGIAGPSREVSQRDQIPSGAAGAGRKNDGKAQDPKEAGVQPVRGIFRKTELHGELPEMTPAEQRKIRNRTLESLKGPGATVSYQPFEKAFRDFTCSLIEHQYFVEEQMLLRIADLQQQIDVLERRQKQLRPLSPGTAEAKP